MRRIYHLQEHRRNELALVRVFPQLNGALCDGVYWIEDMADEQRPALKKIGFDARFVVNINEFLFPEGAITPIGVLPILNWMPLAELLPYELPVSAMAGTTNQKIEIKLIASPTPQKSSALLTNFFLWKDFCEKTALARIHLLSFAASEKGQILILGDILPALPGMEFWARGLLLLPAGYDLEFPTLETIIAQKLVPDNDNLVLFSSDGSFEFIPLIMLVKASRSGVRRMSESGGWI